VPLDLESLLVVGERFHVKPLLPLLSDDGRFYVLALSLGRLALFQGTQWQLSKVDLHGFPTSLDAALKYDDPEKQLQFHTGTRGPGGTGMRPATFHGQGVSADDDKDNILRFFQRVDEGIQPFLQADEPLVLAGVGYLHALYRDANSYPHLMDEGIEEGADALTPNELRARAWRIVQPQFVSAREQAAALYRKLEGVGSAKVSGELEEIARAAYCGRIASLFVAIGLQRWGTFDSGTNAARLCHEAEPGSQDLLDFAAVQTLMSEGAVYVVKPEQVPGGGSAAAVFRY
jgi:hypothetical protein